MSASEHTANLTQEFRTITTLDGAPLEVLETSDYANSTLSMVGAFTKRSFAVNATYRIGSGALRPYVGVGIGVSMLKVGDLFFQSQYYCLQELCELADPSTYNARQTGDMTDTVLSQRVFVGVDRALRDGLLIGLRLIGGHAGSLEYEGLYDEHPVPNLTSTSEFGNINHLTLSLRLKYLLGV